MRGMCFSQRLAEAGMNFGLGRLALLALSLLGASGCTNFYGRGIQYQVEHHYAVSDPQFLRTMSSLLEPLIMAVLGVLVGGLVVAMYLPIFKLGAVV